MAEEKAVDVAGSEEHSSSFVADQHRCCPTRDLPCAGYITGAMRVLEIDKRAYRLFYPIGLAYSSGDDEFLDLFDREKR